MEAIILLAGYGSRLARQDLPHKALLPFGEETLLSRHLKCLQALNIQKTHLVLGHNAPALKSYVESLNLDLPIHFIDNPVYRTTGNTLSMVMGLKHCQSETLILDGDVLYPPQALLDYVQKAPRSSFALVPADIDNEECAKVLLSPSGTIHAFITKRELTAEEKSGFGFGGEAIGFFMLRQEDVPLFVTLYENNESAYEPVLWEIPFTEFARTTPLHPWNIAQEGCFEIDTQEDYCAAFDCFQNHPAQYQLPIK
ncbi:MAG: NTP transferase domain-containing protein [Nitrospinaceae bacterium]|nr:NTP transferase domain-containing protein [Nitrospina sp.]MBT5375928.1 NTP transferase domain-containing protein [Nitrospinaceae bacterium]MBT5869090.1 NTP transferase domain-containing protein [Nitrospinaceae bacterium]MBT6346430.1 NTP transferase domain-containing protein [Nitrospina sp.]